MGSTSMQLGDTLLVTLIGMLIVFVGLIILIGLIVVVAKVTGAGAKEKNAAQTPSEESPAPVAADIPEDTDGTDPRLIAVLAAAVAAAMEDGAAFTVRRVRRVSNASAWANAGREDQIYSRM